VKRWPPPGNRFTLKTRIHKVQLIRWIESNYDGIEPFCDAGWSGNWRQDWLLVAPHSIQVTRMMSSDRARFWKRRRFKRKKSAISRQDESRSNPLTRRGRAETPVAPKASVKTSAWPGSARTRSETGKRIDQRDRKSISAKIRWTNWVTISKKMKSRSPRNLNGGRDERKPMPKRIVAVG